MARNEQVEIALVGAHWNPRIPDHVQGGVINYPPELNQGNEGSRGIFLLGLEHKLKGEMHSRNLAEEKLDSEIKARVEIERQLDEQIQAVKTKGQRIIKFQYLLHTK